MKDPKKKKNPYAMTDKEIVDELVDDLMGDYGDDEEEEE